MDVAFKLNKGDFLTVHGAIRQFQFVGEVGFFCTLDNVNVTLP